MRARSVQVHLFLLPTRYISALKKQAAGSLAVHGLLSALTAAATRTPRARPGAPADPGAALAAAAALLNLLREPAAAQRLLDGRDRVAALVAGVQVDQAHPNSCIRCCDLPKSG